MKKNIRKIISGNIINVSLIGIICGIITAGLAVLCLLGTDLTVVIAAVGAVSLIGSVAASVCAVKKLNVAVSAPAEKLAAGEGVEESAVIPAEFAKASAAISGGMSDREAINEYIAKLATGDFSAELPESASETETGKALAELAENMNRMFGTFTQSAQLGGADDSQVSGAFAVLSAGAEEQAGALQELSASVDSIRGTVDVTAETAKKADKLAASAAAEIEAGNVHMQDLLAAMDNISKSTDEITKFVKVIEDIAFQTNILALNSSVEAARAGGAGKGFAVVAGEVKNLAAKSQEAARQTTAVIEECVRNVRAGVEKTGETAKSLASIAEQTSEVSRLVGVISDSCGEQRNVIVKIDEGVDFIGTSAKRTGDAVQVCAASVQQSAARSDALKNEIANFRFKPEEKPAKPARRTAAKAAKAPEKAEEKAEKPVEKKKEATADKAVEKAEKPVENKKEAKTDKTAEKPADKKAEAKPAARTASAPRASIKKESYANAEFVETPDSKY